MSAKQSMHKWSRGSRNPEVLTEQLKRGYLSEKQFEYEYRLELNKLRRRLQNLEKSIYYEIAIQNATLGKHKIDVYTLAEAKRLPGAEEKAEALAEVARWADHPALSVKEWEVKDYYKSGKRGKYLFELRDKLEDFFSLDWKSTFDKAGLNGLNLKKDFLEPTDKGNKYILEQIAVINARAVVNKRLGNNVCGIYFSDVCSFMNSSEDGLKVHEVEQLRKAKEIVKNEIEKEIRLQLEVLRGRKSVQHKNRGIKDLLKRAKLNG